MFVTRVVICDIIEKEIEIAAAKKNRVADNLRAHGICNRKRTNYFFLSV